MNKQKRLWYLTEIYLQLASKTVPGILKQTCAFSSFYWNSTFYEKKKTFKNFIVEIRLKMILKLEGGLVLDLSIIEYFPGFGEWKKKILSTQTVVGPAGDYVKFCFLIHFRHMSVKVSVHFSFNFLKICVLEAAHNEEIKVIVILQLSAIFSHWFYVLADSMFNLLSRRGSCLC